MLQLKGCCERREEGRREETLCKWMVRVALYVVVARLPAPSARTPPAQPVHCTLLMVVRAGVSPPSAHPLPGLPLSTRGAPPHVPLDAHLMREPRHLQLRLHSRIDPHEHALPVPLEGEEAIHGA